VSQKASFEKPVIPVKLMGYAMWNNYAILH